MSPSLCLMSRETSVEIVDISPVDPGTGGAGGWMVVFPVVRIIVFDI